MFKRRQKPAKPVGAFGFALYDGQKNLLGQYEAASLPLRREAVIEKSIEFFQDPNPCLIHEGAVKVRMLSELEAFLKEREEQVPLVDLPDALRAYLEMDCAFIQYISQCR